MDQQTRIAPGCCHVAVKRPPGGLGGRRKAPQVRGVAGADGRIRTADLLIANLLLERVCFVWASPIGLAASPGGNARAAVSPRGRR